MSRAFSIASPVRRPALVHKRKPAKAVQRPWQRVRQKALLNFTRSFAVMISAKLSIVDALQTATRATSNRALQQVLEGVRAEVQRGRSLSEALAAYPGVFDAMYIDLTKVGEAAGILDEVLLRLADHYEKTSALKRKIRAAFAYPAVILFIAVLAIGFFLTTIVPTFAEMFAQFGAELPGPTLLVIGLSETLAKHYLLLLLGITGLGLAFVVFRRSTYGGLIWDRLWLRVPLFGKLTLKRLTARFCRTLGTLLGSGITLVDALDMLSRTSGNQVLGHEVKDLARQVRRGASMHQTLQKRGLFPPMVVQMIAVGEQTAELSRMMKYVGRHYEGEIEAFLEGLTSIIEPVLIILIGLVIGSILMAMYMPMFDLINVIG